MESINLTEYSPQFLAPAQFSKEIGEYIYRNYNTQVNVEFPSPKTDDQWQLTSQGWVGYIPLTKELSLTLLPKVPLGNLFRMMEYAYRLKLIFPKGITESDTLQDFYENLAHILALRILDRERKGIYREYRDQSDQLSYIKGRMDIQRVMKKPWDVKFQCDYQEHMSDIEDNQILAWTLYKIARSGLCKERTMPVIRKAFRSLQEYASLQPYCSNDCIKRLYNRLNQDYQPMHILCRFFLDQVGPSHEMADYSMIPFLIDMSKLFELFVAEWLKLHLPTRYSLKSQERLTIGEYGQINYAIDLVLYDGETGSAICIMDTKYKTHETPSNSDINQAIVYAYAKDCKEAVLIYPTPDIQKFDEQLKEIRVRTLPFSLNTDLEKAGQLFLDSLLAG